MEVRHATSEDADEIGRVQELGWQAAYRHVFPVEELDRGRLIQVARWRDRLAHPPSGWSTFVAVTDETVVGFASVGPSRDEGALGELYAIYVEPEAWSGGVGQALLKRAEKQLGTEYDDATLWVLEANPRARAFYEHAGWVPDGERKADERWGVRAPELRYRKRLR